jgi:hypothetical protein
MSLRLPLPKPPPPDPCRSLSDEPPLPVLQRLLRYYGLETNFQLSNKYTGKPVWRDVITICGYRIRHEDAVYVVCYKEWPWERRPKPREPIISLFD